MLAIRLRKIGKNQRATYRFIVSEKTRAPQSAALEFLGSYDPHTKPATVKVEVERMKHWLSQGAQPSDTVHNLLVDAGIITKPKVVVAKAKKSDEPVPTPEAVPAPKAEVKAEEKPVEPVAEAKPEEKPADPAPAEESGGSGSAGKKEEAPAA